MTWEEKGGKAVTQSRSPVDARSSERDEEAAKPTSPNIVVVEQ